MQLSHQIRLARSEEADLLTALGVRSKAVWKYSDAEMSTFQQELRISTSQISDGKVFVLTEDGEAIAYYALLDLNSDSVELQHMFVDPRHLKRGLGTRLYLHAIAQARTRGFRRLVIQSDPNAAGFYIKQGLQVVREIPSSIPNRTIPYFEVDLS